MQFNDKQLVAYTRFILDNSVKIDQVEQGLWKVTARGQTMGDFDTTRTYPTYEAAVAAIGDYSASNISALHKAG